MRTNNDRVILGVRIVISGAQKQVTLLQPYRLIKNPQSSKIRAAKPATILFLPEDFLFHRFVDGVGSGQTPFLFVFSFQERIHEVFRLERAKIIDFFANPYVFDGKAQFILDR